MRQRRSLATAVILSVMFHGLLLAWLAPVPEPAARPVLLEVELLSAPELPAPEPEPLEMEQPSAEEPVSVAAAAELEPDPEPMPRAPSREAGSPPDHVVAPRTVLNLQRPANWDLLIEALTEPAGPAAAAVPFNPGLGARVAARQSDRRRHRLLAARSSAVYGTADEHYTQLTGAGTEIKRDGGCAVLKEDRGVEEGTRWWASQCTDTRQNPLSLAPVEYDALGRIVAGEAR